MSEAKTLVLENTTRRDVLIDIEKKYQETWEQERTFEVDAVENLPEMPEEELHKKYPKFMATMAYPYMNGVLHAGHSYTMSKAEFATGYERMKGKRALFPMGFHCTGMPIRASADKLAREIEQFGENFEVPEEKEEEEEAAQEATPAAKADPTKFRAQKSKAVAKQGKAKYQHEIMMQLGIPREEVHKFADANYWITYFPPKCQADCTLFGARIDWRRSFVTTDVNPYYDSMIRWQMKALKALDKIKFGMRYTIYSPKDGQPCMDHDRQVGEAVNPQEYVGIKIAITEFPEEAKHALVNVSDLSARKVYLVAATLRPETMYGQTCCFVSPKITYGLFDAGNNEYFITTERAFRNMAFQDLTPRRGHYAPVAWIPGSALVGAKISAPLAQYDELRVLPMETILANKGTGVVTCVPSDSPDDYITQVDLAKKPEYYHIEASWIADPVPVVDTPTYGTTTAKTLVEQLKINSPKDKDKLAEAKEIAYKEGFYMGVMAVGKYAGEKVEDAKPKVREDMVKAGQAFVYSEPEGLVISRSGDECVVSLEDQWYNDYGEDSWKAVTEKALARLETFSPEARNGFEKVLDWLRNWALSRTYGLGTRIPWDEQYLVESLSDSTIYMAYYTICHFLHKDYYGQELGSLGIPAEDMTDEVWNYVFCRSNDISAECKVSKEKLDTMRNSFRFFYPLDLRVSGKDLIPNHLTFFLYCHTALFSEEFWPRGIRANGHLMLNNEKMSKSTGNFLTLREMLTKFGSDATRIALADAGDTFEDANFDEANANAAILRLHTLKEWTTSVLAHPEELRCGEFNFYDRAFASEMNQLILDTEAAYEATHYKAALKSGLFDLQIARDYYRDVTNSLGLRMHQSLVKRYIEVQALLLTPIAPHFGEYVWREVLGNKTTVHDAKFPTPDAPVDQSVIDSINYVRDVSRAIREAEGQLMKKKKKGTSFDPKAPSSLTIYIADAFPEWQESYIELVRDALDSADFTDMTGAFKQKVSKLGDPKRGMQFVSLLRISILGGKPAAEVLDRKLSFNEPAVAKEALSVFQKSAMASNIVNIQIVSVANGVGKDVVTGETVEVPSSKPVQDATPGSPGIIIANN
ncbi:Leucine--tRNA ligase, cytoplasmic [Wickerhamiella sorbophila]|uniref:leucine--tRNA ligase n=1 Tax=Wickerhamiella sorbophila TaxID=45607 RepID=A0A2T0FL34_9ASCO|nr:Leucine--tRNA ligase, cytoplasmic [Wickerhamiella sorbophila]PRT55682.1 Leucine--tRNA ligase, cytoplasmic [Wickerhamiella sorbophila]